MSCFLVNKLDKLRVAAKRYFFIIRSM
jgi:hypothetical protein